MRLITNGFVIILAGLLISNCKTTKSKDSPAQPTTEAENESATVAGVFDENMTTVIPIPNDLPNPPTEGSSTVQGPQKVGDSAPKGLGLSDGSSSVNTKAGAPANNSKVAQETVIAQCYGTEFNAITKGGEGWHFWAGLYANGVLINSSDMYIQRCGEVQISLAQLDGSKKYQVKGKIYYASPANSSTNFSNATLTVVYYDGETTEFKAKVEQQAPIKLILKKVLLDQKVDVFVQQTPQDVCKKEGFFWSNGCLKKGMALVFHYTDRTDYAQTNTTNAMCLDWSGASPIMNKCTRRGAQIVYAVYKGSEQVDSSDNPTSQPFYALVVSQSLKDTNIDGPYKCITAKEGHELAIETCTVEARKNNSQLFSIQKSMAGDLGGRDTYKIISTYKLGRNQRDCITVPYDESASQKILAVTAGSKVALASCSDVSKDLLSTQFLNFLSIEQMKAQ